MHINHETYYHDRLTERDLCFDFPGDAILIDGLHAMQSHFGSNNVPVDIPVVRVMNTAHFLAAYMFATTCSGDQMEYDVLAYGSIGHDKKLVMVTMLVLAAMLERTEGVRAHNCRNLIISGRGEDFEEGMTLYERFLRSAEKRFAEEDFLIDTHAQIQKLIAENEQLTEENKELKIKYQVMEEKYTQYNIGTQNNYTGCTINNYYSQSVTDPQQKAEDIVDKHPSEVPPSFFCISSRFTEQNIRERLDAELSLATTKIDYCRALYRLQHIGCIDLNQYASDAKRAIVFNSFQSKFTLSASDFCKARAAR